MSAPLFPSTSTCCHKLVVGSSVSSAVLHADAHAMSWQRMSALLLEVLGLEYQPKPQQLQQIAAARKVAPPPAGVEAAATEGAAGECGHLTGWGRRLHQRARLRGGALCAYVNFVGGNFVGE